MERIYKVIPESNNNFLFRNITEIEWEGIFCVTKKEGKEGKFPPSLKCEIISGKKSVIRYQLKFKDVVSILSSTLTEGMTSDKLFQGSLQSRRKGMIDAVMKKRLALHLTKEWPSWPIWPSIFSFKWP